MKWLFSILLIANLGLFIWLYPQREQAHTNASMPERIGGLRLVGEAPAVPDSGSSAHEENLSDNPESAHRPPKRETTADDVAVASVVPPAAQAVAGSVPVTAAEEPQQQCETIGVFDKRVQAELLSVQLLALGLKPEIASETSNEQAGYWVLIPPQANRDDAVATAKELEAAGVADLWRFTSGNLAHAISLGLFRDEERAIARKAQIAALGFNPEVRPRYREQTRYWLNFQFTGESPVKPGKWREFKQMFPDIETSVVDCP